MSPYYTSSMCRSLPVRSRALLLATILLAGGAGLPLLDALVFHQSSSAPGPRLPGSGVPHSDGDACVLRLAVHQAPKASPPVLAVAVADWYFRAAALRADAVLPRPAYRLLPPSRAPPAHLA